MGFAAELRRNSRIWYIVKKKHEKIAGIKWWTQYEFMYTYMQVYVYAYVMTVLEVTT